MAETVLCGGCGRELAFDGTWRTAQCEECRRAEWAAGLLLRGLGQTAREVTRRLIPEDRHDHGDLTARYAESCDRCGASVAVEVRLPRLWARRADLAAALADALPDACPRCGTSLLRVEESAYDRE